ncbi:MAG: helix-hairpin-helix domain-containing protein [Clostridium sp.]
MNKNKRFIGAIFIVLSLSIFLLGGYALGNINSGAENGGGEERELLYSSEDNGVFKNSLEDTNTVKDLSKGEGDKSSFKSGEQVNNNITSNINKIKVDVKGAVLKPGIYTLKEGDRIDDLIKLCGGLTEEADVNRVYFSKKLCDEDIIYIFKNGEDESSTEASTSTVNNIINSTKESTKEKAKININKASLEELKTLNGVGDSKANAIISYREKTGGFKDIKELTNVEGIGEKTLNKFMELVDIK